MARQFMRDFFLDIARGKIAGMKGLSIPGRRDSVGTTVLEDLTQTGNAVLPRPAGADLDLESVHAQDDTGGTGIQTVMIHYLDSSGDEQSASFVTNGSGVTNVGTAIHDVQWMHATAVGTNTVAEGIVKLVDQATGNIIYEQISAEGNQSLSGRFKIPNNKTGYIMGWQASAVTRKIDFRLRADVSRASRTIQSLVFNFQDAMVLEQVASGWVPFVVPLKCPELSTIKISALSFTGAGDAGGQFDIILIDD